MNEERQQRRFLIAGQMLGMGGATVEEIRARLASMPKEHRERLSGCVDFVEEMDEQYDRIAKRPVN